MEELIKKIEGMFVPCTDMVKTEPKDIEQEKLDAKYNLALTDVLNILKQEDNCQHDWFNVKDETKGKWRVCKQCNCWEKLNRDIKGKAFLK